MRLRIALVSTTAAMVLATLAGFRAAHLDLLVSVTEPASRAKYTDPLVYRRAMTPPHSIEVAAEQNPFHHERRRGGIFHVSDLASGEPALAQLEQPLEQPVQLIGTAVSSGRRSFVLCAVDAEPPRVVRLGGSCGILVLKAVARGTAAFRGPDGESVVLEVPKAAVW